jgi:hypothetical protein
MKSPIKCPSCNDALRNNFLDQNGIKIQRIEKICDKHLTHQFRCYGYDNTDTIYAIDVEIDKENKIHALFQLATQQILVYKGKKLYIPDSLKLPYFVPDLTCYDKLISKLRTYILLS